MACTGLAQDRRFQEHRTGPGHPERPERLQAIETALQEQGLAAACTPIEASPVDMALVRAVHDESYLERLAAACRNGRPYIDVRDSAIVPESFEIAQLAAGCVVAAADAVIGGNVDNAFCAVRPPGHHAERHMSLGFCLLNNIAIAAQHLIDHHLLERILIVDWDVHHGNGTQHIFESDPRVYFISLHGHPGIVYPGTGYEDERGKGAGLGYTMNLPMLPPSSDAEWQRAFDERVIPAVDEFKPEFVLISAGFDAHKRDPLAPLELTTEIYGWMTDRLCETAAQHSRGRLVSVLEGGYDLQALGDSVCLHVRRLLDA